MSLNYIFFVLILSFHFIKRPKIANASVDNWDATNSVFDLELISHNRENVTIPVIAFSGAGKVEHFSGVFEKTKAEAALAAGIFYREEVPIEAVKEHMREKGTETRKIVTVSMHIKKGPSR